MAALPDVFRKIAEALQDGKKMRVIFSVDKDVPIVVIDDDVKLWKRPDRKESLRALEKGRKYYVRVLSWAVTDDGGFFIKVRIGGTDGWINARFVKALEEDED